MESLTPDAIQAIAGFIGSLGFPIVCCIFMFRKMNEDRAAADAQRESDRLAHRAEMDRITDALHNNTLVMQKLVDALTVDSQDGKHS